ncbi:transcriptional regulator [Pseudescherichia vulneris]|nr:transcriptional regulator [Pseudescherichia vulneris]
MEYKDPMIELLSSLEQIVFKDESRKVSQIQKPNPFSEFEKLRKGTGLKIDDFARVMGVSVAMVHEWESKRVKTLLHRVKTDAIDSGKPTSQPSADGVIFCPLYLFDKKINPPEAGFWFLWPGETTAAAKYPLPAGTAPAASTAASGG